MKTNKKSLEASACETLDHLKASSRECLKNCEAHVRQEPITSMVGAILFGYFLRFLPIGFILGAIVRLLLLVLKPALVLIAAAKLYEKWNSDPVDAAAKDKPGTATDPVQESPPGPPARKQN